MAISSAFPYIISLYTLYSELIFTASLQDDRSSPIVQRLSERSGSPTNEPKLEANVLQQLGSSLWWILAMGIEHDKIHLETSSAIIAQVKRPLSDLI